MTPVSAATATAVHPLDEWEFRRVDAPGGAVLVRLPHDAMLAQPRSASSPGGADTGWFIGGDYDYRTTWRPAPADAGKHVALRFEGVQGDAVVSVNGVRIGV